VCSHLGMTELQGYTLFNSCIVTYCEPTYRVMLRSEGKGAFVINNCFFLSFILELGLILSVQNINLLGIETYNFLSSARKQVSKCSTFFRKSTTSTMFTNFIRGINQTDCHCLHSNVRIELKIFCKEPLVAGVWLGIVYCALYHRWELRWNSP